MGKDVIVGKRGREQKRREDGKMVKRKTSEQRTKRRKTDKPRQQNNRVKVCKRERKEENLNAKKNNDEDEDDGIEKVCIQSADHYLFLTELNSSIALGLPCEDRRLNKISTFRSIKRILFPYPWL